jgi:hypothetical protein
MALKFGLRSASKDTKGIVLDIRANMDAPESRAPVPAAAGKKLISIFGAGVQKGGTTSLDAYFCEHPQLSAPIRKELNFFNNERIDWSNPDYSALESFYSPNHAPERIRFDVTPVYAYWPNAVERIKAYNPDAKLVYLFRDPFERAWSHWCMVYSRGKESLMFAEAIRGGRRRMKKLPPLAKKREIYSYIERGLYADQVRRALACFPRDQLLFLRSEDFSKDHLGTLSQVSTFLGIAPFPTTKVLRKNRRPLATDDMEPTDEDRKLIYGLVRDDVLEFAELTGLDVSEWPSVTGKLSGPG